MKLGITAIVKDELAYIEEWLLFHKLQGISSFFLYDNDDSPGKLKELCDRYSELNITVYPWPGAKAQLGAYEHSIYCHRDTVDWMAFIDVDEFLYSPSGMTLPEVLHSYGDASIVAVHWLMFGSSGRAFKDSGLVIERFTKRGAKVNEHVKSICRMSDLQGIGYNPHTFRTNGLVVDEGFNKLHEYYAVSPKASANILAINHYHTKSLEEYKLKCQRGRADNGELRDFASNFAAFDLNEVSDTSLYEYAAPIRELLR